MFNREYLDNLRSYVKNEIPLIDNGNEVIIKVDYEIKYILTKSSTQYTLYIEERGSRRIRNTYNTEIEMKRKFALLMKNVFGEGMDYKYVNKFENIKDLADLQEAMIKYSNKDYFSINDEQADKINLKKKEENIYDLYFMDKNNKKYIIVEDREAPFIFRRFYTETVCFYIMNERIREYENVFKEDVLDYNTKKELLGYR